MKHAMGAASTPGLGGSSVLLHSTIDTADEDVCGIESNGACEQPEAKHHHRRVAKVQQCGDEIFNLKLVVVVCV